MIGGDTRTAQFAALVAAPAAAQFRTPDKLPDLVGSTSPAKSAIATSQLFFRPAPVVLLVDPTTRLAQSRAIRTATMLAVPVLIDHPQAAAEIARFGARTVLPFGRTRAVQGTWRVLHVRAPNAAFRGWKDFVGEDHLMLKRHYDTARSQAEA